jgi:hypothetical protein
MNKQMKVKTKTIYLFFFMLGVLLPVSLMAQDTFTQNISGIVLDEITREPLLGANVVLENTEDFKGTSTDENGRFVLNNIPVGRVSLKITYLGYYPKSMNNINLGTGKQLVLNIELQEAVIQGEEVEVVATQEKTRPINRMATVSARSFSIEESQRFAGARNDISRMASNFAGVNQGNDSRNDIIIRGNSPIGLLWRYEGVDIPNPNHYGAVGSTGGPVSILNNNVLANSDFFTGAFPAEYGNAFSGVFDLSMRNGNQDQHEFIGQIGFNGFEFAAEGPIDRKSGASYLISYRYSTMAIFSALGVDYGTGTAVPKYQDLSLKMNVPTKKTGKFSLFALGGISEIEILESEADTTDSEQSLYTGESEDLYNTSTLGVVGLSHTYVVNNTTYTKFTLAASYHDFLTRIDSLSSLNRDPYPSYRNNFKETKLSGIFYVSKKINAHHNFKSGVIINRLGYNLIDSIYNGAQNTFYTISSYKNHSWQYQPYISWQYRATDKWTINGGLHYLYYSFNQTQSLEPRLGIKFQLNPNHSLSFGYGLHSQTQPITSYVQQTRLPNGTYALFNKDLDLLKSHHFVLGYDWLINDFTRIKTEVYYQHLYNAAVNGNEKDAYSILNQGADFYVPTPDTMNNDGSGTNYGLEITLEQFLNRGFYYLFTASLYESKYKGSDGVERNTAFNGNFVINGLLGKEFEIAAKREKKISINTLSFDIKATYAGGKRYTPLDVDETIIAGAPVYVDEQSFEEQFNDYFRFDLRVGFKQDFRKFSMEFSMDVQNLFNVKNVYLQRVNTQTGEIRNIQQLGRLVIPQFVIRF